MIQMMHVPKWQFYKISFIIVFFLILWTYWSITIYTRFVYKIVFIPFASVPTKTKVSESEVLSNTEEKHTKLGNYNSLHHSYYPFSQAYFSKIGPENFVGE